MIHVAETDGVPLPDREMPEGLSILYVYEGFANPGDGYVYVGSRTIIQRALPIACEQALTLRDEHDLYQLKLLTKPDIVAVVGAPWIFDNAAASSKLRALHFLRKHWPDAVYLALGIGSCVPMQHCLTARDPGTYARCVDPVFAQFDFIATRDPVGQAMLEAAGIASSYFPCPSLFLPNAFPAPATEALADLAVLTPPSTMWHYEHLEKDVIENYEGFLASIPSAATRYAWINEDIVGFPDNMPPPVAPARNLKSLARFFSSARAIWTTRVHVAVPARAYGCDVTLYGVDSRALTARAVGCNIAGPYRAIALPEAFANPSETSVNFSKEIWEAVSNKISTR